MNCSPFEWIKIFTLCLLGFAPYCHFCKAQEFNFIEYNVATGLSQSEVMCLVEDQVGYLWLGTQGGGLNRFDGKNFTYYTKDDGLLSNYIHHIIQSRDGKLIMTHDNLGITTFDGKKFKPYSCQNHNFELNFQAKVVEDKNGAIWVSSLNGPLYQFTDTGFVQYDTTDGLFANTALTINVLPDGNLWVSHPRGHSIFDNGTFIGKNNPEDLSFGRAHFLIDGTAYYSSRNTLYKQKGETLEEIGRFPQIGPIRSIYVDRRGWVWVSAFYHFLLIKDGKIVPLESQAGLGDLGGHQVIEDKTGNLWLGTRTGGVYKFSGETFTHFNKGTPLYKNAVFAIEETNDQTVLIGTDRGVFELKGSRFVEILDPEKQSFVAVRNICTTSESGIYVRSILKGVFRIADNGKTERVTFPDSIETVYSIHNIAGTIFAGTDKGICRIEGKQAFHVDLGDPAVNVSTRVINRSTDGTWWLGGDQNGMYKTKDGKSQLLSTANELPHNYINNVVEDKNKHIWIGTSDGLVRHRNGQYCYLTVKEGLIGNLIYCLLKDYEGNLWAGTEKGISKILLDENSDPITIRNYGYEEGFIGVETNEGAFLADSQNNLWFGTVYGVTKYNPKEDRPNYSSPTVQITGVQINQVPVDWTERTGSNYNWYQLPENPKLAPDENTILFDFAAVALDYPHKVQYKYKLEGLDKKWSVPSPDTRASYSILPSGTYTFKVVAGRTDGAWSPKVKEFTFTITQPYYQTWWFKALMVLIIGFVFYLVIRYRFNSIERQRRILAEKVAVRTREVELEKEKVESANQVKSDFLAKMSHEIRTPMNGVIGMTDLLRRTSMTDQQRRFVDNIQISGKNLLNLINDILDFSRIESGKMDLESAPLDIRQMTEEVLEILAYGAFNKDLELLYHVDPEIRGPVIGDPARIKQIMVNLVGNAIKFTKEGRISVQARVLEKSEEEATLEISVRDSGIGIPKEKFANLFDSFSQVDASTTRKYGGTGLGLAISYNLSKMMGGNMWVESTPGEGSTFFFTIKVGLSDPWKLPDGGHPAQGLEGSLVAYAVADPVARTFLERYLSHWNIKSLPYQDSDTLCNEVEIQKPTFIILDARTIRHNTIARANLIAERAKSQGFHYALLCEPSVAISLKSTLNEKGRIINKPLKRDELLNALLLKENIQKEFHTIQADKGLALRIPLRIMIAEDNPINMEVATGMLNSLGYEVSSAENGAIALEKLEQESFDIIFMDVQMPVMDGLEATRRIISTYELQSRPLIIAMTANAMESDRQACLEAGMTTFISKPFVLEELVELVHSIPSLRGETPVLEPMHTTEATEGIEQQENTLEETATVSETPEPEQPSYEFIDLSQLFEASNGEATFVVAIAGKLVKKLPESIDELREHLDNSDWEQVRAVAHRSKSSAAYTGAKGLRDQFGEIEHMARDLKGLESIPEKLDSLEAYVHQIVAELKIAVANLS